MDVICRRTLLRAGVSSAFGALVARTIELVPSLVHGDRSPTSRVNFSATDQRVIGLTVRSHSTTALLPGPS